MSIELEIVRDLEALRKPCREVNLIELLQPQAQELIQGITNIVANHSKTMVDGIRKGNWMGLAAPQVGHNVRIYVGYLDEKHPLPVAVINPQISKLQGQRRSSEECVSLPGVRLFLTRTERLVLKAFDRDGKEFEKHLSGIYAAIAQHETDHLNGKLIIDRR